jgi:Cdc6-like AAA superfamily ATPase
MTESPFALRRFEYERTHLYYLPHKIFKQLEQPKPIFLIGSRGTGKTTLLKALSWEEQLRNQELDRKLKDLQSRRGYLGAYIRVPETLANVLSDWPAGSADNFRGTLFCLYIDLMWVQSLTEALSELVLRKIIKASPQKEFALTESILVRYPELLREVSLSSPFTLKKFATVVYQKRRTLEKWALSETHIQKETLQELYPLGGLGEFGRSVAAMLSEFCTHNDPTKQIWKFKVCLDETEALNSFQQVALNTSVRLLKDPVFFVVSYVRTPDDLTRTLQKNITLGSDDRDLIVLDEMRDKEFMDFAEGVASVRLEKQLQTSSIRFKTQTVLGSLDINQLLFDIIHESASPESKNLLKLASSLAESAYFRQTWHQVRSTSGAPAPPIYQAYIISKLGRPLPAPETERWVKRRQDSAEIRKRMVAAYLCACAEMKRDRPKYASSRMVFQMSDKCIRDYLNQMDAIYQEAAMGTQDFCSSRIPSDVQDAALFEASKRKKDAIRAADVGSPIETLRLIDALGQLTKLLQTNTRNGKSLRLSEMGLFSLDLTSRTEDLEEALRLVIDASEAGFLKIRKATEEALQFRVHCSLAAAYGFSYRGAYYSCPLRLRDLQDLYRETDSSRLSQRLLGLADGLLEQPGSRSLFEE